jgi:hypothetical protein
MTQRIDMSPDAVTARMIALDQLWELAVALQSSRIMEEGSERQMYEVEASITEPMNEKTMQS